MIPIRATSLYISLVCNVHIFTFINMVYMMHMCMYKSVYLYAYREIPRNWTGYSFVSDKKVTQRKIEWNRKV